LGRSALMSNQMALSWSRRLPPGRPGLPATWPWPASSSRSRP